MRVGTRWSVGSPVPDRIPAAMRAAVHTVEEELRATGQDTAGWGWTLTYLEGAPIADLDDGTRVRMADGEVALVTSVELDEAATGDWAE